MFLDNHLSWDYHINQLGKKLSQANGILAKLCHNAPLKTVLLVCHAIFYSHLPDIVIWASSPYTVSYSLSSFKPIRIRLLNHVTLYHTLYHTLIYVPHVPQSVVQTCGTFLRYS